MNDWTDDAWDDDLPEEDWPDDQEPAVVPCPACGAEFYEDAPCCPICGEYVTITGGTHWTGKPTWYILLAITGILATMLALLL